MGRIKKEAVRTLGYSLVITILLLGVLALEGGPGKGISGITGNQVLDDEFEEEEVEEGAEAHLPAADGPAEVPDDLLAQVRAFANSFPLTKKAGNGAEICLLIDFGDNNVKSFDIFKDAGLVEVQESQFSRYCNNDPGNSGSEDFIIKYVSYEKFKSSMHTSSCKKLKENAGGKDFYYLPSEFIQEGGKPVCNRLFQVRYCPVIQQCVTNKDMPALGMDCCIVKTGLYRIPGYGTWQFWASVALMFFVTFFLVFIIIHLKHKEERLEKKQATYYASEVEDYIISGLKTGHTEDEVREKLLDAGWEEEFVDPVFEAVNMRKKK
jgi:hypothetical protein